MMDSALGLRRAGLAVMVAVALGSTSCADRSDAIAPAAARQMRARMDVVRAAIDSGDVHAGRQALRDLERMAVRLRDGGLIEPARADVILASAREVAMQLSQLAAPPSSPSPTASASPSPAPSEDEEKEGEEHGNGKDKGRGDDD